MLITELSMNVENVGLYIDVTLFHVVDAQLMDFLKNELMCTGFVYLCLI